MLKYRQKIKCQFEALQQLFTVFCRELLLPYCKQAVKHRTISPKAITRGVKSVILGDVSKKTTHSQNTYYTIVKHIY